jgi:uncharacterized protein (DUF983 family)
MLITAILCQRCPRCLRGRIYRHPFSMYRRCPVCDYDYFPESGFYLGAMMVPFFFGALTTVPFAILLKVMGFEMTELVTVLAIFYAVIVGSLLYYARAIWLHLEYRISRRIKESDPREDHRH